eukprot:1392667-Pyramimonas_sp.AAC.1
MQMIKPMLDRVRSLDRRGYPIVILLLLLSLALCRGGWSVEEPGHVGRLGIQVPRGLCNNSGQHEGVVS